MWVDLKILNQIIAKKYIEMSLTSLLVVLFYSPDSWNNIVDFNIKRTAIVARTYN